MKTNTVLITGASSGIGRQLATDYHALGWQVIACGRDKDRLQQTPAETHLIFDVQDLPQILEAAKELKEPLDLVILNAGTCEYIDDAKQFDAQLMQRVLNTNVIGVANCLEAFNGSLRDGGQLALMGSAATHLPFSRAQAYGASKAAIVYLADSLRVDLKPYEIDVSLIQPGFVDTPLTEKNTFNMPGLISVKEASNAIIRGLDQRKSNIYAPRLFNWILRCLGSLPSPLPTLIASRMK